MKKIFLLVFMLTLVVVFYSKAEYDASLVFNEDEYIDNYDCEYFYIASKDIKLNTNNLSDYFSDEDIRIMGVYPNLEKIYNDDLKNKLSYYSFSSLYDNKININNFTNNYVRLLKNNSYIDEANMVYFDGINIDKVLVYTTYNSVYLHDSIYHGFSYKVKEF
ncbi:MAG: hypothetical protein HFI86_09510 [Bacilli bacterium]|nr:hypothetical protein [Bacilli bacterium]